MLGTAVEGGNPPDLATIAQPGLIEEFQKKGALKPLDFAKATISANYPPDFVKLGTIGGKLYSFVFKGANKSTVWFNVNAFKNAGVEPPKTWDELLAGRQDAEGVGHAGVLDRRRRRLDAHRPVREHLPAPGGRRTSTTSSPSTRSSGPTRRSRTALKTMAQILSDTSNIVGGKSGALQTDFPTSVSNVFTDPPKGAMVIEGDFVPGVVASKTKLKPDDRLRRVPVPVDRRLGRRRSVGGGDSIAMFKRHAGRRRRS